MATPSVIKAEGLLAGYIMKRWTNYIPIDGSVVGSSDNYTEVIIPSQYLNGKKRVRIRISLFPDTRCLLTPVIDSVKIAQHNGEKIITRTASPRASEFVQSTIFSHTGADQGNLLVGRAERVADRNTLGGFPMMVSEGAYGTWLDTASGFQLYMATTDFEFLWIEGVSVAPDWIPARDGWRTDPIRRWLMATPHPSGGVSFVRMQDWWAGTMGGLELWWCDAPERLFNGHTPDHHKPIAWIWEWSDDKPPQPYGPLYMCEACREYAVKQGYKDIGFGGDNDPNRFVELNILNVDPETQEMMPVDSAFITRYSTPAAVSGRAYEYYYGHAPLHNTTARAHAVLIESAGGGGFVPIIQNKWFDEDGDGHKESFHADYHYPWAVPMIEGRNVEQRGMILGQVAMQPLINDMNWYDPWFSAERESPIMIESFVGKPDFAADRPKELSLWQWLKDPHPWPGTVHLSGEETGIVDFQAPRQYVDARSKLSRSYFIGEWSFPTETVFKYRTRPDEIFHETFPVDMPLGMRGYNMGAKFSGGPRRAGWVIEVLSRHFYIGSNSSTLETGEAPRDYSGPAKGLILIAMKTMLGTALGGLMGSLGGLLSGLSAYNSFESGLFGYHRPKTGVSGNPDRPTKYIRMGHDSVSKQYLLDVPNNVDHSKVTTLPNGSFIKTKEKRTEQRFGGVPSVSAFYDYRGEIVALWPHHKRWMNLPTVNMQTIGYETQYRVDKQYTGWVANPNRMHRATGYGAINIQVAATTNNRWALLLWDSYIPAINKIVPCLQLVDIRKAFAPNGFLRNLKNGVKFFVPGEETANKIKENENLTNLPAVKEIEKQHAIADPELQREQNWRHIYPLPIKDTNIVLLAGDKEIISVWNGNRMVASSDAAKEEGVPLSHIYLRISPFSLFAPPSDKSFGDGMAESLPAIPLSPPLYKSASVGQGYSPTLTIDSNGDVLLFYNKLTEPGRILPYHGGGTKEYESEILPGHSLQVKIEGAPLVESPEGEKPAVQLYLSLYPAGYPLQMMRLRRSSLQSILSKYIGIIDGKKIRNIAELEAEAFSAMFDDQEKIATDITNNLLDEGLLIARDGPPIAVEEFEPIYNRISVHVNKWLNEYEDFKRKSYQNKKFGDVIIDNRLNPEEGVMTWIEALINDVYNSEPFLSKTQCYTIISYLLEGVSLSQAAVSLAMRHYLKPDADIKCPACGAYELTCTDTFTDKYGHLLGFFSCGVCGYTFEEDCHYVELEYADAIHDPSTDKTWICGGVYEENQHLGIVDGNMFVSWQVRGSKIWSAERAVILSPVDYDHIQNSDPGPAATGGKPYLWDQSDTAEYFFDKKRKETKSEFFKHPLPPVEIGQVEHITYIPPHKPRLLVKNNRLYLVILTRELYDAQLAKMEREDLEGYKPGDHIASTASPTIPRIFWTTDAKIWNSDYHKRYPDNNNLNKAPEKDVYQQPKRDFWELPEDLKDKSGQG